jgi:L-fuculose-phosphate aldolase
MPSPAVDSGALRRAEADLVRQCRELAQRGLVLAAAGNASVAVGDHVLLTATGVHFSDLEPPGLTLVDRSGNVVSGDRPPTSELALHLAAYRRADVGAVVHTHGRHAVALSTLTDVVPAIHYYCADLGGPIPVAPYHCYGTQELAEATVAELGDDRTAVVMAHHGSLTVAASLAQAAGRAELLEWLCEVTLLARAAGSPSELSADQLDQVRARASAGTARKTPDNGPGQRPEPSSACPNGGTP